MDKFLAQLRRAGISYARKDNGQLVIYYRNDYKDVANTNRKKIDGWIAEYFGLTLAEAV